jgi:4-oxalocrotonate tautomerase
MPHVVVKLLQGRTEEQKSKVAEAVTKAVMATANVPETAVSVCIEDVAADRWTEDVYTPDILGHWDKLYQKPGYEPS